jgi:hypothetical protein
MSLQYQIKNHTKYNYPVTWKIILENNTKSLLINFNIINEWKLDHTIYQAPTPIGNLRNKQSNTLKNKCYFF